MFFFFQAEDGIRDLVRSRGLGDVYKRQRGGHAPPARVPADRVAGITRLVAAASRPARRRRAPHAGQSGRRAGPCLLYTSDAADERSSGDLGGRRILTKKKKTQNMEYERTRLQKKRK